VVSGIDENIRIEAEALSHRSFSFKLL
jgi:hypothetical protein